jgi:SAM-dependent methyltransferase
MSHIAKRTTSFGLGGLSIIDHFGIWLSKRAILKHVSHRENIDVLEIGCGFYARNLIAVDKIAASLTGVDFSISESVKSLQKFTAIEEPVAEAKQKLEMNRYDLIMIISVLEHLDDPLETLHFLKGLLRDGGVLLINVPTWRGKFFLEYSAFKLGWSPKLEMDDHKMYYDKKDLWPLLVRAGFMPSQIKLTYHKFGLNLFGIAKTEI